MSKINALLSLIETLDDSQSTAVATTTRIPFTDLMVGKYVLVRSRNEGINAGYVKSADANGILLTEARRLWYHKPMDKSQSWYEGVANSGLSNDSKISAPVSEKAIMESYSITVCTEVAAENIKKARSHEQQ